MESLYHRIKWSDEMVKLLITGVAYIVGGNLNSPHQNNNSNNNSQRKGKWRAISCAMKQRGYIASPQQCEDKFNDLNKKYKRLNEILGKSTAYDVIQNPSVLDSMNLCDETAEEIIRLLSSKQLFYREMCSYHNRNWQFLARDESLEHSLNLAFNCKLTTTTNNNNISINKVVQNESGKGNRGGGDGDRDGKREEEEEEEECSSGSDRRWIVNYNKIGTLMLIEKKLIVEQQRLMLEKKWLKWRRYSQRQDRKLETMRLGNKLMKLQNQRLAFHLQSLTHKSRMTEEAEIV